MISPPVVRTSLRAVLAWCLLSGAGFIFVRPITVALLPLMEAMVNGMQSDFKAHLFIEDQGSLMIALSCTTNRPFASSAGGFIPPDSSFSGGAVDAVHALVPLVIFLVAVASWPINGWREAIGRAVGAVLLLPPVVALTTIVLLVGRVEHFLHHASIQSQSGFLLQPYVFMEEGGRWLVPLLAATFCTGVVTRLSRRSIVQSRLQR